MIGQKYILEKFNSFENIPLVSIFIGPRGSGKKTLIDEISKNINVDIFNVDSVFNDETKISLCSCPSDTLVIFDLTKTITEMAAVNLQNASLKFIEDLPENLRVIILVDSEARLLDTVSNRCQHFYIDKYSKEEILEIAKLYNKDLSSYTNNELRYLKWPSDIISAPDIIIIKEIELLIDTIFSSIGRANISNTLSISKKINFNNEIGLYDLNLFLNIFDIKLAEKVLYETDKKYAEIFTIFNLMVYNINGYNNNKRYIFEEFLLDIKDILT